MNITPEQLDAQHLRDEQRSKAHELAKVNLEYAQACGFKKLPGDFNTKEWKERLLFEWDGVLVKLQTKVIESPTQILVANECWVDQETYDALITGKACAPPPEKFVHPFERGGPCPKCGSMGIIDASQSLDCNACGYSW